MLLFPGWYDTMVRNQSINDTPMKKFLVQNTLAKGREGWGETIQSGPSVGGCKVLMFEILT